MRDEQIRAGGSPTSPGSLGDAPACSSSGEARVELVITHYEHLAAATPPIHLPTDSLSVSGEVGWIQVTGTIRLPDHCDVLRAHLEDRRPILELKLRHAEARGHEGGCVESDRSVAVAYRAEIRDLPPAQYRLRVIDEGHTEHRRGFARASARGGVARLLHDDTVVVR